MKTRVGGAGTSVAEGTVRKPRGLQQGSVLLPIAPASPAEFATVLAGAEELRRLGFHTADATPLTPDGYFAGTTPGRREELLHGLERDDVDALIAVRGGYGSNYIVEGLEKSSAEAPKMLLGYSDLTALQLFFWKERGWMGFYAPMLAAGFAAGAGAAGGYDKESFLTAVSKTDGGWTIPLSGESLVAGEANGTVVGGCLTLLETALGTPWELETQGAILLLEDRGMKPWQVDRALMHLKQADKFHGVRGIVLGDFPGCDAPVSGSPSVRDVCRRILGEFGVPVVYGAPVGHTQRPMLTVPLGVRGRLIARGAGELQILEPAVVA